MHPYPNISRALFAGVLGVFLAGSALGADAAPPAISAADLAAQLSASQEGSAYVRASMELKDQAGETKSVLQLQIKERRTKASADVVYQVLWPKERKGEGVFLHKTAGRSATGFLFTPPGKLQALDPAQLTDSLFGSQLSYQDVIENFFAWESQAIVGSEAVAHVNCQILESKPGKGDHSPYASVRTWVDTRRVVPLRVEKYLAPGRLDRRIETTRVAADEHRFIPANLTVHGSRDASYTEIDGSRIQHDVKFDDREFSPDGLKEITGPRAASE